MIAAALAAALLPGLWLRRIAPASLTRAHDAWLVGLSALGIVAYGWHEPWWGVLAAYLWAWWLMPAAHDPLGRAGWQKLPTLLTWAGVGGTWVLARELPAWAWAWLPTVWGVWAWGASAAIAWQWARQDRAKVRAWWGMRSVAGSFLALVLPLLPLWTWPGPLVGLWLTGPSWLAVLALTAASWWRWPWIGPWVAGAGAATGATLTLLTACRPRAGDRTAPSVPDTTPQPRIEASDAVKSRDRDDDPVGPGRAGGPRVVERPHDPSEAQQVGLRGVPPGVLHRALGSVPVGPEAEGGPGPQWWTTLRTRPLELTPRGDSLDSLWHRLALLRLAWQDAIWRGAGPGTTPARHRQAAARGMLREATGTVHCEPAQVVSEYGLAGGVALGLFVWRVAPGLTWGDPWSAMVVAGGVLACGSMALRVAPIGLIFLLACAEVTR